MVTVETALTGVIKDYEKTESDDIKADRWALIVKFLADFYGTQESAIIESLGV